MKIKIERLDGSTIVEGEYDSFRTACQQNKAKLYGANLGGADLVGAILPGANLDGASLDGANLVGANLDRASLVGARLGGAKLVGANLYGASLVLANLYGANLVGARLDGANLDRARLDGATGISPERCTPLLMLLEQPGTIHAYKLVKSDGEGPFNGGVKYTIGETVTVENANTDPNVQCAKGINVATLDWCLREWRHGYRVLIVAFEAKDIACIPTSTDGKFRLHRCRVVGEKDIAAIDFVLK